VNTISRPKRVLAALALTAAVCVVSGAQPASAHHGYWGYSPSYSGPYEDWTAWTIAGDNADVLIAGFIDNSGSGWYQYDVCLGTDSCGVAQTDPHWMSSGWSYTTAFCGKAPPHYLTGPVDNEICPNNTGFGAIIVSGTV
jgi:hypothetical protein